MTYSRCKKMIENKSYESKEDMQNMLDVFFMGKRITQEQYKELTGMLAAQ